MTTRGMGIFFEARFFLGGRRAFGFLLGSYRFVLIVLFFPAFCLRFLLVPRFFVSFLLDVCRGRRAVAPVGRARLGKRGRIVAPAPAMDWAWEG